jgi:uncharacterized protein YhfF
VTDSCGELWRAFLASGLPSASLAADASYVSWQFGYGREQGDRLLDYVLHGPKRATAGALWTYEHEGEPLPRIGEHSVVTDGSGVGRCVIVTSRVETVAFDAVDAQFAFREGEGDRSLGYWRRVHWEYFTRELAAFGLEPALDMPIVCESFELLYPPAASAT